MALSAQAGIQVNDLAFAHRLHRLQQPVKIRTICLESVARHANHNEAQRGFAQVDQMFELPVNGQEDIKPTFRKVEGGSCLYCRASRLRSPSKPHGHEMRHARRSERIRLGGYAREQGFFG